METRDAELLRSTRNLIAQKTFAEFGAERLRALCGAIAEPSEWAAFASLFERMVQPWGNRRIEEQPRYASNVADDEAPFEFSLALSDEEAEVQVYVDAQGDPPTARSNLQAGRALLNRLASEFDAPLDRLHAVADLFLPDDPRAPFALWIGASWAPGRAIKFKIYLNPAARRDHDSISTISQAMERFDLTRAWSTVLANLARGVDRYDEASILCLDLARGEQARVKVYIRHHGARIQDIQAFADVSGEHKAEEVAAFYRTLAGYDGPFLEKPALTQLAFVGRDREQPVSTTLTFPLGQYVENDAIAYERIHRCLKAFGLPCQPYDRALQNFATRPLEERAGIHAHATLRRVQGQPRVAVYFASEAYARISLHGRQGNGAAAEAYRGK